MDQEYWKSVLSGRRRGPGAAALRAALWGASVKYAAAMRVRRWAYRRGLLPSHAADLPVICVGNLTTGGTGKTPMVAWIVEQLQAAGCKPAILTRGYKPRGGAGDEAELLRRLTGAPVIVSANRRAGARAAAGQGADVAVMDDGFQHLALRRDLDIVLIDATCPFGFGRCLPRGLLREAPSALRDADAVVITRSDQLAAAGLAELRSRLAGLAPAASLHAAVHRPACLIDEQGKQRPPEDLKGRKVSAFCGLGNPHPFFATLERLGADVINRHAFDDHAAYSPQVAEELSRSAAAGGCALLVTTQKDHVKLPLDAFSVPLWQLVVRMEITAGREELTAKLLSAARRQGP